MIREKKSSSAESMLREIKLALELWKIKEDKIDIIVSDSAANNIKLTKIMENHQCCILNFFLSMWMDVPRSMWKMWIPRCGSTFGLGLTCDFPISKMGIHIFKCESTCGFPNLTKNFFGTLGTHMWLPTFWVVTSQIHIFWRCGCPNLGCDFPNPHFHQNVDVTFLYFYDHINKFI